MNGFVNLADYLLFCESFWIMSLNRTSVLIAMVCDAERALLQMVVPVIFCPCSRCDLGGRKMDTRHLYMILDLC